MRFDPRIYFLLRFSYWVCLFLSCILFSCSSDTPSPDTERPQPINNTPPKPDPPAESPPPAIPAEHPIEVRMIDGSAKFWNAETQSEFTVRGVNYFWIVPHDGIYQDRFFAPGNFEESRVRSDFELLASKGYNTVRIFLDTCNDGPNCIGNPNGNGLNTAYVANIIRTIEIAEDTGIFLLLTSNDLPDSGGYWEISNEGANEQFEGYRNAHYLTPLGILAAQKYWGDLIKAIYYGGAPLKQILAWSLLNEQWYFRDKPPFSLTSGLVTTANGESYDMGSEASKKTMAIQGMVYYIEKIREVIDYYDPNALVTMGFFAPNYPNPIGVGDFRYVETADLLYQADLDFFDFHAYPGEDPLFPLAENYGMLGYTQKPVILGEFGCFLDRYPDLDDAVATMQSYQAESCEYGFDGWLHWGMYMAPTGIGDATWGFMNADKEMLEGLAPVNFPDACDVTLLLPENVSINKTADASNSLSDESPENAIDGNYDSQWGSGSDAPQWLLIDLETEFELTEINLRVAQYPEGNTIHVLEASTNSGEWDLLEIFDTYTREGDILTWEPTTLPGPMYRFIRITTTSSPSWVSWKEVEVFGK